MSSPKVARVLAACALAACSSAPAVPPTSPVSPAEQARITRIEQGLLPAVRVRGEDVGYPLAERMRRYHVPGLSIAVFEHGQLVWAKGYGVADLDTGTPVTATTLFQAASISKPVNAAAALLAAERGALSLDGPINDKLIHWKLPDNALTRATAVTLRQLLSHTAGTTVHGFAGYAEGAPLPSLVQILDGQSPANNQPVIVDLAPGSEDRYSGGGIQITQLALTDQLNRPYADILADTVLRPIGMARSTFVQPLPADRVGEAAAGHDLGAVIPGKRHVYPEQAAAGLWTTPSDLARFFAEIQRGRAGRSQVIPQAVARIMTTPVRPELPRTGVGVGLRQRNGAELFGHNGSNRGFECNAIASLDGDFGVVIMANAQGANRLFPEIERAVFAAYGWSGAPPEIDRAPRSNDELAALAGRWADQLGDPLTISVQRGALILERPFWPAIELVPVDSDVFIGRQDGMRYRFDGDALVGTIETTTRRWTRLPDATRLPLLELAAGRFDAAVALYRELERAGTKSAAIDENRLNFFAYAAMREGDARGAVQIFRLLTTVHPTSANAHDSLGDGCMMAGDRACALAAYQAAVAALPGDTAISAELRAQLQRDIGAKIERARAPAR